MGYLVRDKIVNHFNWYLYYYLEIHIPGQPEFYITITKQYNQYVPLHLSHGLVNSVSVCAVT